MAHEYGHFLTNRFRPEVSMLSTHKRVPAGDRFADSFAGCLLMPPAGLRRRFNDIVRASDGRAAASDVHRLANYYFVSVQAMMRRMQELRLLPSGAWDRLSARGLRVRETSEPLGLFPQSHDDRRLPIRYRLLAVRAYEEGKLTEGEFARILRVDRVSARRIAMSLTHSLELADQGNAEYHLLPLAGIVKGHDS